MGTFYVDGTLSIKKYLSAQDTLFISSKENTSIVFRNGTTIAARINPSGCLNLGTDQSSGDYKLYVAGKSYFEGKALLRYPDISSSSQYLGFRYISNAGTVAADHWYSCGSTTNITSGKFYWRQYSPNTVADTLTTGFYETYSLPTVTTGLTENKTYEIFTSKSYTTLDNRYQTQLDKMWNLDKRGTSIPAEADLNDYTTSGLYYSESNANTQTLINCPVSASGFKLIVMYGYSGGTTLQLLLGYGSRFYLRGYKSSVWDEWIGIEADLLNQININANGISTLSATLNNKVDKVSGKGLSTNDYTTDEKNKLAGIAAGANKTTVDSALSSTSTNPVQNKVVNAAITNAAEVSVGTTQPTSSNVKVWYDTSASTVKTKVKNGNTFTELQGVSGVYVGTGTMPSGYNVQINPAGDATSEFALSGHGLGEFCAEVTHWDSASTSGFYTSASGGPDTNRWWGVVVARSANYIEQKVFRSPSGVTVEARRSKYNGTWQPWEWVSPPMTAGVEYRTTERWSGKAVYTNLINLGTVTAESFTTISIPGITNLVRCVPNVGGMVVTELDANVIGNNTKFYLLPRKQTDCVEFYVISGSEVIGSSLKAQIWYTK